MFSNQFKISRCGSRQTSCMESFYVCFGLFFTFQNKVSLEGEEKVTQFSFQGELFL